MTTKTKKPSALGATKEKLLIELQAVEKAMWDEQLKKHYPLFKKKYEGKYFTYQNAYNSTDKWIMYIKVTRIDPDDLYQGAGDVILSHYNGFSFQTNNGGEIIINLSKQGYCHMLEKEITKKEFMAAWHKMDKKINSLNL